MSDPSCQSYTLPSCHGILAETISLLQVMRQTAPELNRLNQLLESHFLSDEFRSICCFGRKGHNISLALFNSLCILPSTDWGVTLHVQESPSSIMRLQATPLSQHERLIHKQQKLLHCAQIITTLMGNILLVHPDQEFIKNSMPLNNEISQAWILAILGLKTMTTNVDIPGLPELRRRITLSLNAAVLKKRSHPPYKFFSQASGFLWQQVDDTFDVNQVYLEVCASFPKLLEQLLVDKGQTLDQLAGVSVARRYPKVEALVRDALSRGQKHGIESTDLKLADGSLGGTVFAIHNAHYSPEWIAAYLVDTDNNVFMEDVRAGALFAKERLLRIFSTNHTHEVPSWIQFGDKGSVYLYFSRLASAAEQSWLKISSYVINLLIDTINSKLKLLDTYGKYLLSHIEYDTGVVALGNPSTSSLGGHQDGKPGIVCPHTPGFSRWMLMVPTMAFQNHCAPTATISWWRSDDPTKEKLASFTHDFFINHYQLLGVNDKFHHEVRVNNLISPTPPPTPRFVYPIFFTSLF